MNQLLFSVASSVDSAAADGLSMPAMSIDTATSPAEAEETTAGDAKATPSARKAVAKKATTAKKASSASKPAAAKKVAAVKKASKPTAQAVTGSPKPQAAGRTPKKTAKRPRLVRDSFTMPESDFDLLAALKSKALDARRAAKKSELLRAGLRLLSGLEAKALVAALDQLEPVKVGRPRGGH